MMHFRLTARLGLATLPLVLSFSVMAADPSAAATATPVSTKSTMDLRTPSITKVMTQQQIDAVLSPTYRTNLEEVEVDSRRLYDPNGEYIPGGFAALLWGVRRPSGLLRLFTPRLVQKTQESINPTNPSQPAPAIPAMAGEGHPYDR